MDRVFYIHINNLLGVKESKIIFYSHSLAKIEGGRAAGTDSGARGGGSSSA